MKPIIPNYTDPAQGKALEDELEKVLHRFRLEYQMEYQDVIKALFCKMDALCQEAEGAT